jgi:lipoprotein NlpI
LIPIKSDGRMPMMEVYAMYRGESTADKVMEQARSGTPSPGELNVRLFYANLYVGLFLEAAGKHADAMKHIRAAVDNHPVDHYMWEVARVHLQKSR